MKYLISLLIIASSFTLNAQFTQTVVSVTGATVNDLDQTPAKAQIKVFDTETGKMVNRTRSTGRYFVTGLKPGKTYEFEIQGKGYFFQSFEISIPNTDKYAEFSKDFTLKPMEVGTKIPMKVIPFDIHKTKIKSGIDYLMEDIVNIMRSNRMASFELIVYPENDSNPEEAKKFATERANAIHDYLMAQRVRCQLELTPMQTCDPDNPKPTKKRAKGKRYKGSIYLVLKDLGSRQ